MTSTDVWASTAWLEAATTWLDDRLAADGHARTGAVNQARLRPWGTVLTAPTTSGTVWLKAPGPETVFEVPLYELLAEVAPGWVLVPGRAPGDHRRHRLVRHLDGGGVLNATAVCIDECRSNRLARAAS